MVRTWAKKERDESHLVVGEIRKAREETALDYLAFVGELDWNVLPHFELWLFQRMVEDGKIKFLNPNFMLKPCAGKGSKSMKPEME